jgi:predicted ArsR family transcriptional regulator
MLDDRTRYRLFSLLKANPELSQRQLAGEPGVGVGKINFCLNALLDEGLLKVRATGSAPQR